MSRTTQATKQSLAPVEFCPCGQPYNPETDGACHSEKDDYYRNDPGRANARQVAFFVGMAGALHRPGKPIIVCAACAVSRPTYGYLPVYEDDRNDTPAACSVCKNAL